MPNNVVSSITMRNFGFSDAAELFVFISGFTAAFLFGRMMRDYGFVIGATRLWKRVWQLYLAHVMLFVVYVVAVGYVAFRFKFDAILHEYNVVTLLDRPFKTLVESLALQFKPLNIDVLPLYIVLMALFPFVLWIMLRRPGLTMLGSLALYLLARQFGWNLVAYPHGSWYFNPFCWQVLFCFGAWVALGGRITLRPLIESRWLAYFGFAYLIFALILTPAAPFKSLREVIPQGLFDPSDKTNLALYRALHFFVIALLVARYLPKDWKGLQWPVFDPLIKCGQQSLRVFCVGVVLSFMGYFLLSISSGTLLIQITISVAGLGILCGVAYYGDWSKKRLTSL
jgi:hypothetical protein